MEGSRCFSCACFVTQRVTQDRKVRYRDNMTKTSPVRYLSIPPLTETILTMPVSCTGRKELFFAHLRWWRWWSCLHCSTMHRLCSSLPYFLFVLLFFALVRSLIHRTIVISREEALVAITCRSIRKKVRFSHTIATNCDVVALILVNYLLNVQALL